MANNIGGFLSQHTGSYYAAMNNYLATSPNAEQLRPTLEEMAHFPKKPS